MALVHLPAMRKKSLETLSHTALSVAHLRKHPVDVAIVFNAANAPFVPLLRRQGIPVATHVDGLEWKRSKWQGAGSALLPQRRVDGGALVRRPDRRRPGHRRLLPHGVRRRHRAHHLRRADHRPAGEQARRARPRAGPLPPRRRPLRAGEPRRRHRRRLPAQLRRPAARGRRVGAVRRRAHRAHPLPRPTSGCTSPAASGTRTCSTSSTPTARPTCTGTRSVARTRRCCGPSAPARPASPSTSTSTARSCGTAGATSAPPTTCPTPSSSPRSTRSRPRQRGRLARELAYRYDWDDVAARYERLCERLVAAGPRPRALRPSGRRRGIESLNPVVRLDELYVADSHAASARPARADHARRAS